MQFVQCAVALPDEFVNHASVEYEFGVMVEKRAA